MTKEKPGTSEWLCYEQSWSSGLGPCLSTRGSCSLIPIGHDWRGPSVIRLLEVGPAAAKCLTSPSLAVGPALSRPGANKKWLCYQFFYSCDQQGYCNRVLDFFPVNNFVHRIVKIRI